MAYLLFAGNNYYPEGGVDDLIGHFDTIEDAVSATPMDRLGGDNSWANIFCLTSLKKKKYLYGGKWFDVENN
jgi:hypothetical protein